MIKATVLLSGGMDSTIALYWALQEFEITTITFNYWQRHGAEMAAAKKIADMAGVPNEVISFPPLSDSALTNKEILIGSANNGGLPNTFVPTRNILFFTMAVALGYNDNIYNYVGGMCQADSRDYPDCRKDTLLYLQRTLSLGLNTPITLHLPLIDKSKAEALTLAQTLDGCMEALKYTYTCYEGALPACGRCPACLLRLEGFNRAGLEDPIKYREY